MLVATNAANSSSLINFVAGFFFFFCSYLHSCDPPIIHGNLTCDTIFIQHNGLIKIGSGIIYRNIADDDAFKNLQQTSFTHILYISNSHSLLISDVMINSDDIPGQ